MGLVFRVCGVFAIIVVVVAVLFREHLSRLHRVASLFNEDKIVFNFKTADTWGMPFRTMKRGNAVSPISANENRQLPKTFKAGGKDFPVETWLEKHGSTGLAVLKIAKDGKSARLLHETYWHNHSRNTRCISWSVGKSVVSAAVGVAVDKKLINLEHTVDRYLPQLGTTGYQGVRIKDVLQMSSGIAFDEDYFSPFSDINMMGYWLALGLNMDDFVARLKRNLEPGKFNHYLSMDTQVLGMLVAAASNQTLSSFIEEHIWSKVGFEHDALFLLDNDRAQRELAFGTILSTTIDFARFGWLYLNKGKSFDGTQIVSADWVTKSLTPDAPHLMPNANSKNLSSSKFFGYGYHWWIAPDEQDENKPSTDFLAIGVYGQFIGVFPDQNIVIAKNSAFAGYRDEPLFQSEIEALQLFRAVAKHFSAI